MGYSRKKANSRVFQIVVRGGGKFCPNLGEVDILLGGRGVTVW